MTHYSSLAGTPASIETGRITGLILAGGRGTRMGTVDKGLQTLQGTPLVAHVLARLAPQVGPLAISANQNLDTYRGFGLPVWPDEVAGFAGPLAGLQTGMRMCRTEFIVTAPCDSPFLPADLVERLSTALQQTGADIAVAVTGGDATRQPHPVFCMARTSLLPHLTAFLSQGERKFGKWYASLVPVEVPFADEEAFRNINTLDELQQSEHVQPNQPTNSR